MKKLLLLMVVGAFIMSASPSRAGIPHLINYQGMLTDDAGIPINEPRDLTFTIYDALTNGTALWTETHTAVPIEDGLFNVILGGGTTPVPDSVFDEPERYLGIKVGSDPELTPRIQLTSVGYAYRALLADSAVVATPVSGSHWMVSDSILYTNSNWGIARGGSGNVLYGDSAHTMVNLGIACTTGTLGNNNYYVTISGGYNNRATDIHTTVSGGEANQASGQGATVGGGVVNSATHNLSTVSGGQFNTAGGIYATVSGGWNNTATGWISTIGGGSANIARGEFSVVAGGGSAYGDTNAALGDWSTIPGGRGNVAKGNYSFAAGRRAQALHQGTFVWSDSTDSDFASTGNNQFLIRASGGVGIGTNNPQRILHIKGYNPRVLIEAETSNPELNFMSTGDPFSEIWALYKDSVSNDFRFYQNGNKVTIQNSTGNVGIGTTNPQRALHISDVLRLEPRTSAPSSPSEGDIYVNSSDHHIYCYLNGTWERLDQ
jgi:hypothetical protein